MINIKLFKDEDLSGSTFIEGFPGLGLVGPMAVSYIIDKLGMRYIGYMESEGFPPIVSIHESKPMPPIRVYFSDKKKILAIFAEFPVRMDLISELANKVFDFVTKEKVEKIISISGIPGKGQDNDTTFVIASNQEALKAAQKEGLRPVVEGVSAGVSALLLFKASSSNITDTNILVPVDPSIIDPKYAEQAIISINKLLKLNIDVTELEKEAKEVEAKIQEMLKKSSESQEAHRRGAEGPSMYG
ncbi:MAG TPA: PAC2 family protein [Candidatus Acidoferrum sp.]|nr:PAC2 family protein [Candidatus Acidoferrum sp.]